MTRARVPEVGMFIFTKRSASVFMLTSLPLPEESLFMCELVAGVGWSGVDTLQHLKRNTVWTSPEEWEDPR